MDIAQTLILALKHESLQMRNEVESLTSKAQLDAEVSRAMIRDAELTAQSTTTCKLCDAKACFENEKRRLFSLATDLIDELSYRQLLRHMKGDHKSGKKLSKRKSVSLTAEF
jgi:hypothetical protein